MQQYEQISRLISNIRTLGSLSWLNEILEGMPETASVTDINDAIDDDLMKANMID
jgi:hypothetical protein